MILDTEVRHIATLGRNSYRRIADELGEAEWLILRLDNILVPFRAEVLDLDFAERYAGNDAYILLREEPEDEEGSDDLTWEDLIGFEVFDTTDAGELILLGKVASVDETTVNTLLILEDKRMIPAHEDLILSLDLDEEKIIMNLPYGL